MNNNKELNLNLERLNGLDANMIIGSGHYVGIHANDSTFMKMLNENKIKVSNDVFDRVYTMINNYSRRIGFSSYYIQPDNMYLSYSDKNDNGLLVMVVLGWSTTAVFQLALKDDDEENENNKNNN